MVIYRGTSPVSPPTSSSTPMKRILLLVGLLVLFAGVAQAQVKVELPEMEMASGAKSILLPIRTADLTGKNVKSFDFTITYNPAVVKITGVSTQNALAQGMFSAVNANDPGTVRVSAASGKALEGQGVLLYLVADYVAKGESPLRWQKMQYNEGNPGVEAVAGRIAVGQALPNEEGMTATGFTLGGNYPNPFEAATTIRFALAQPAAIELQVFDVLGRPVHLLARGPQAAGEHTVTFTGEGLPGGLYFYRLTTPTGTLVRKMTLVR